MAKTREEKKNLIDRYKDILKDGPNYFLVDTNKVNMEEVTQLKNELKESNASFYVLKNTLFKIAADEKKQPTKVQEVSNATGIIITGDDPTASAKALKKIQDEFQVMKAKFGVLIGEIAEPETINSLAEIPPREELLAKLVWTLNSPLSGFVQVPQGNIRDFVFALSEIQKTKADAA